MRGLDEALTRFATYSLRGRIWGDQLGVRRLNLLQLLHEQIKLGIADLGIIEHVVAMLVMPDLVAKEFDFISLRLQRLWRHCGVSAGYQ